MAEVHTSNPDPSDHEDEENDADAGHDVDQAVVAADHPTRVARVSSSSTISSFKSVISSTSAILRRSPRKATKPSGWYSELHDFDKDY